MQSGAGRPRFSQWRLIGGALHSLRRWFVWAAREALLKGTGKGYSPWTIAEVVGHSKAGVGLEMTMSRYSGDKSLQAKAAGNPPVAAACTGGSGRR
jgi:hypothetical protein